MKKRRIKKLIALILGIIIIIAVAVTLSLTVFFRIDNVAVTGDEIYNNEDVIAASQINIGDNMFMTSKKKTASGIECTLPYVESAEIKRNLSGTITIKITAATAKLAIDNGDSFTLVSDKGKVLEDGLMTIGDGIIIIDSSPVISAVPGETVEFQDNDDLGIIKNVLTLLESNELSGITSIDVSNHSNIKMVYKERVTVLLGLSSSVNDKMDFVKAALTRLDSDNPDFTGSIDFTIDKKAYLSPQREDNTTVPFISA